MLNRGEKTETFHKKMDKESGVVVVKKNSGIQLWSSSILSNWFFVWVLPILEASPNMKLALRPGESSKINTDLLDTAWQKQLRETGNKYRVLMQT